MKLADLPSSMTDWSTVPSSERPGESGRATVRSRQFGEIQLRLVEYSASYVGDHWCHKGHLTFVVACPWRIAEFSIHEGFANCYEIADGPDSLLRKGD